MGSTSGGSTQTTQNSNAAPWATQAPYLSTGFDQAGQIYADRTAAGPFTGSFYSPDNSIQTGAANTAAGYTAGAGASMPGTTAGTAQTLQAGASPYVGNASSMAAGGNSAVSPVLAAIQRGYATGGIAPQGVSSPLSGALQSAAMRGANGVSYGQDNLQSAAQLGLTDQTARTAADANTYANNPTIDAAIAAAKQPLEQTLQESTLPGLNRAASMGGNLNSSRAAMAEAMANRDTATQEGNLEATMRGNAYNNGLNLSAQQTEAGTNAAIAAGSAQQTGGANAALGTAGLQQNQGQFNATTQLGAADTGLAQDANIKLAANNELGSGVTAGVNAGTAAGAQASANLATGATAGGLLQTDQNNQLADAYQQWQAQNGSYQQGLLNNYWGTVGSANWGNNTAGASTVTPPSNLVGQIAGGGTALASLFAKGGALDGTFSGNGALSSSSLASYFGGPYAGAPSTAYAPDTWSNQPDAYYLQGGAGYTGG